MRRVEEDLEVAEAELRAAEGRVQELRTVREGLRIAQERYSDKITGPSAAVPLKASGDAAQPAPVSVKLNGDTDVRIAGFRLVDATMHVLRTVNRPLTTREVYDRMQHAGRHENYEQVRNSLNYLKRVERVKRAGQNWELSGAPAVSTAGAPTDPVGALLPAPPSREADFLHSQ
jgi:hypothetical protein